GEDNGSHGTNPAARAKFRTRAGGQVAHRASRRYKGEQADRASLTRRWTMQVRLTGFRMVFPALLTGLLPSIGVAQGLEYVKAHYTKYEYRVPMRDGKRLFTAVYVPKDQEQHYPILLNRTPYSVRPYGVDQYRSDLGPSPLFGKAGYIFVYQDVRGRW